MKKDKKALEKYLKLIKLKIIPIKIKITIKLKGLNKNQRILDK